VSIPDAEVEQPGLEETAPDSSVIPSWLEQAINERLLGKLVHDVSRVAVLDQMLSHLPDDNARLLYLRVTNSMKISPDSPMFLIGILQSLISAKLLKSETLPYIREIADMQTGAQTTIQEQSAVVLELQRTLDTTKHSVEDISSGLDTFRDKAASFSDEIANGAKEAILSLASKAIESERPTLVTEFHRAAEEAFAGVQDDITKTKETISVIRKAVDGFAVGVHGLVTEDRVKLFGRFEVVRWKFAYGAMLVFVGFMVGVVVGGVFGYTKGSPSVHLSPAALRQINEGYALEQVYPALPPATKAQLSAALQRGLSPSGATPTAAPSAPGVAPKQ